MTEKSEMGQRFAPKSAEEWQRRLTGMTERIESGMSLNAAMKEVFGHTSDLYVRYKFPEEWTKIRARRKEIMAEQRGARKNSGVLRKKFKAFEKSLAGLEHERVRGEAMLMLRANGWTGERIAEAFGLTRSWVGKVMSRLVLDEPLESPLDSPVEAEVVAGPEMN